MYEILHALLMRKLEYVIVIVLISSVELFGQISNGEDGLVILKGVVQTSGLIESDESRFGIDSEFQLITDSIPYFLVTDLDISKYWGQCVKVRGSVLEGWEDYPTEDRRHFTFGRSAFLLDGIFQEICDPSMSVLKDNCVRDTITGTIIRSKRPAPDISYDYSIVPIQEIKLRFESMFDQDQFPLMHSLDIEQVNSIIESGISLEVCGCFRGGYAELVTFRLDHVLE